jgi:hypothetical protein
MTDASLLDLYRRLNGAAELLRRALVERGVIHCPECGDKHKGRCLPGATVSRDLDRTGRRA